LVQKPITHTGAVVPAPVEDHDLACRREMREITLNIHLRLLAVGWSRKRDEPEGAWAHPLRHCPDRAAFAGSIAALEHDDDALAGLLDPILQRAQLRL
jgi:hypothetical protein